MKSKYSYVFILIVIVAIIAGAIYYFYNSKAENDRIEQNQEQERISAETAANEEAYKREHPTETEISSFSTPLLDKSAR